MRVTLDTTRCHQGSEQLFKKLFDDGYFWYTMKKDCNDLVATCKKCLAFNVAQSGFHPLSPVTAKLPFDHVAIDLFGPLPASSAGYTFGLVLTDIATRFVCLAPLKDKTAESVAHSLFPWFCTFGFPKIIQSDNGTEFVNAVVKRLVDKTGIEQRKVTPYHPEGNGAAERHVGLTKTLMFKLASGDLTQWERLLPAVQYGLNARISARHKSTPFSLMFGRKLNALTDYTGTTSDLLSEDELVSTEHSLSLK